eukprot:GSChrysophyteH1.ASY1.ANO1.2382.1 assembled CDS
MAQSFLHNSYRACTKVAVFMSSTFLGRSRRALYRSHSQTRQFSDSKKRVLSGVQPTGSLHLGNYLGAIRQWVFVQSHVRAHTELCWLLNCVTPMGWMERMIQYKEKSKSVSGGTDGGPGVGLFDYPVLMAADILLYQTDLVPVGEDQRQHLELTRDIARRFNDKFGTKTKGKIFREPEALIVGDNGAARVMSLLDGSSKMSKSADNDNSRLNLLDTPDVIIRKIKRCKTDTHSHLQFDNSDRPECHNLLSIYAAMTGKSKEDVQAEVGALPWGAFKPRLADSIIAHLEPIQAQYRALMNDQAYLEGVLREGADSAHEQAEKTLSVAKQAMGFYTSSSTKRDGS